jgi:MFS superfamily sulfate permease-like transporter
MLFGVSNLIGWVDKVIPQSIIKGIQLGLGLSLVVKGLTDAQHGAVVLDEAGMVVWWGLDSVLVSVLVIAFLVSTEAFPKLPAALVIFVWGVIVACIRQTSALGPPLSFGPSPLQLIVPSPAQFLKGAFHAGLPQLPLTLTNSVLAVSLLSRDLFGPQRAAGVRRMACSVGALNLVFLWFGAVPSCHGAGGLAAQYRFGARSSVSMIFLGVLKTVLALLFGRSLMALCQQFPASVLGPLLVFSGVELAKAAVRPKKGTDSLATASLAGVQQDQLVFLLTAGVQLSLNSGVAFAAGVAVHLVLLASVWAVRWCRTRRRGERPLAFRGMTDECDDSGDSPENHQAHPAHTNRYECGC